MEEKLLPIMKKMLRITWEDTDEDDNIKIMIRAGVQYLDSVAGQAIDYESDSVALDLLYFYVLYRRSDSLAAYRKEYSRNLLSLSLRYKAGREKKKKETFASEA